MSVLHIHPSQVGNMLGVGYDMTSAWEAVFARSSMAPNPPMSVYQQAPGDQFDCEYDAPPPHSPFQSKEGLTLDHANNKIHGIMNEPVCTAEFMTRNPHLEKAPLPRRGSSKVNETAGGFRYRFSYEYDTIVREKNCHGNIFIVEVKNRMRTSNIRCNQADLLQITLYLGLVGVSMGYLVQCAPGVDDNSYYAQTGPFSFDPKLWELTLERLSFAIDWHMGKSRLPRLLIIPPPHPDALSPHKTEWDTVFSNLTDAFKSTVITSPPVEKVEVVQSIVDSTNDQALHTPARSPWAYMRVSLPVPIPTEDVATLHQIVHLAAYTTKHTEVTTGGAGVRLSALVQDHVVASHLNLCDTTNNAVVILKDNKYIVTIEDGGHRLEVTTQNANVFYQEPGKPRHHVTGKTLHLCLCFDRTDQILLNFVNPVWAVNIDGRLEILREEWGDAQCVLL